MLPRISHSERVTGDPEVMPPDWSRQTPMCLPQWFHLDEESAFRRSESQAALTQLHGLRAIQGQPLLIAPPVRLVPTNAPILTDQSVARSGRPRLDNFRSSPTIRPECETRLGVHVLQPLCPLLGAPHISSLWEF